MIISANNRLIKKIATCNILDPNSVIFSTVYVENIESIPVASMIPIIFQSYKDDYNIRRKKDNSTTLFYP